MNNGHRGSSRRRRRMRRRRQLMMAACCLGLAVLVLGTVLIVKKVKGTDDEPVEVAAEVDVANEEPEDGTTIEVVEPEETEETEEGTEGTDAEDPGASTQSEQGASVNVEDIVNASNVGENSTTTYGIDVSKFQGTIDWAQVASSGINFAMIRVGYRDSTTGEIKPDTNAKYNMQEAEKNGIKIGAYFFSTAVTKDEAIEEADWVASYVAQYPITYPVGYNCEGFENSTSRQYNLTKDDRNNIAVAFLGEVYNKGYTPIFYASKNEMASDAKWNTSTIGAKYKIWMAWYNQDSSNLATGPSAGFKYDMWQYTNQGTILVLLKRWMWM